MNLRGASLPMIVGRGAMHLNRGAAAFTYVSGRRRNAWVV